VAIAIGPAVYLVYVLHITNKCVRETKENEKKDAIKNKSESLADEIARKLIKKKRRLKDRARNTSGMKLAGEDDDDNIDSSADEEFDDGEDGLDGNDIIDETELEEGVRTENEDKGRSIHKSSTTHRTGTTHRTVVTETSVRSRQKSVSFQAGHTEQPTAPATAKVIMVDPSNHTKMTLTQNLSSQTSSQRVLDMKNEQTLKRIRENIAVRQSCTIEYEKIIDMILLICPSREIR